MVTPRTVNARTATNRKRVRHLTTFFGIVLALSCVVLAALQTADLSVFFNLPQFLCVLGGVTGATAACYPALSLVNAMRLAVAAFKPGTSGLTEEIDNIVRLAETAHREGLAQMESRAIKTGDMFLKKGVSLLADGTGSEAIRAVLETDTVFEQERYAGAHSVLMQMAVFAPSFGMIGTLIGVVNLLRSLGTVASIGSGMAGALLATLYGVALANIVFTPVARKVKATGDSEFLRRELQIEGLLLILDGENPAAVRDKLSTMKFDKRSGESRGAGETGL